MRYAELDKYWRRLFELEWQSLCARSKAIAALIADTEGNIISEGRNMIGEAAIPNPRVSHAEVEAIRNLDIARYPDTKSYVLYAALEPCPMCMGTLVMGGIRNVVIGAHDAHGGAMALLSESEYLRAKNIKVTWMPQIYGDIQRGFQAIKEFLYNGDVTLLARMMADFSVYNAAGVRAAHRIVSSGAFEIKPPSDYCVADIFDTLAEYIEAE